MFREYLVILFIYYLTLINHKFCEELSELVKSNFFKKIHEILTFQKFVNKCPQLKSQIPKSCLFGTINFISYFCKKVTFSFFLGTTKNRKKNHIFLANITINHQILNDFTKTGRSK